MPRVVYVLMKVIPGMTIKKATSIMYQAHTGGRAVVKSCHKELAELYEERLRAKGLTSRSNRPANDGTPGSHRTSSWSRRTPAVSSTIDGRSESWTSSSFMARGLFGERASYRSEPPEGALAASISSSS